uniref:Glycoside hydrolase family 38 N-terminal domain-containing protein n=1 Tax=Glossina palpalis gambiensis TaxID=67801 RepID=A0A1B0BKC8_9MUSC
AWLFSIHFLYFCLPPNGKETAIKPQQHQHLQQQRQQSISSMATTTTPVNTAALIGGIDVKRQWDDKCYNLDESDTNITALEEYAKFEFQVKLHELGCQKVLRNVLKLKNYTEYSVRAQFITDENVEEKAQLLLEQYARTGSLFPHNVALIPVGDDFRYNEEREIKQQYTNYKKLIDHIMNNKRMYNVDISFGTPKDYFREIRKRTKDFPIFNGNSFVYSDIFSEGRPAYWSGFYTTRPYYKILSSDLVHNLRAAEILFTLAYNTARQQKHENAIKIFEMNYEKMIPCLPKFRIISTS